jgi:hypothetical protein
MSVEPEILAVLEQLKQRLRCRLATVSRASICSAAARIADGSLSGAFGRKINEVQKLRHVGDYDAPTLARADAEEALQSAQEFVAEIDRLLRG